MSRTRAVIFDCDGVLVDSEHPADRAVAQVLAASCPGLDVAGYVARFRGWNHRDSAAALAAERGATFPEDLDARVIAAVDAAVAHAAPMPGVRAAVAGLALPRAVASNSPLARLRRSLARADLLDLFAPHVYAAEMVARPKPAPDLYRHAARALGVAPDDCLVVEDNLRGVRAACAAGMRVVGFLGGAHARPGDEAALLDAGACGVCRRLDTLSLWL
ncbi:HAD-IA family hydrolase [Salinarimonas chemoclinalis]|uniref:HAD-IA family hydrolase n=1 Tax=Salinarimonas chemoclinalis TaxID=3241599 RepID=UPI00355603B2